MSPASTPAIPKSKEARATHDTAVSVELPDDRPPVRLDVENGRAWCGERLLEVTPKAFAILHHFTDHPQRLITKDELFAAVWGDTVVSEAALTSCIRDLRRSLGDTSHAPRYVQTVHRRGFRFIGPISSP